MCNQRSAWCVLFFSMDFLLICLFIAQYNLESHDSTLSAAIASNHRLPSIEWNNTLPLPLSLQCLYHNFRLSRQLQLMSRAITGLKRHFSSRFRLYSPCLPQSSINDATSVHHSLDFSLNCSEMEKFRFAGPWELIICCWSSHRALPGKLGLVEAFIWWTLVLHILYCHRIVWEIWLKFNTRPSALFSSDNDWPTYLYLLFPSLPFLDIFPKSGLVVFVYNDQTYSSNSLEKNKNEK